MKLRLSKKQTDAVLCITAALFLAIQYYVKPHAATVKRSCYAEMTAAARTMDTLQKAVSEEMTQRGIEIDRSLDPRGTGLIGPEWSGITTTLGNIESKRTTVNPDFAALLARLFIEAGLQKGDYIAANCSSSFPALNLAFIAAADTLELHAVMVTSVGASMYGGNREDFTYLDMEHYLYDKKLIRNKTIAYSLGGAGDVGKDFDPEVIEPLKKRLDGYGLTFLYEADFEKNLANRYAFYTAAADGRIKAFINIGGNLLSLGEHSDTIANEKIRLPSTAAITSGLVGSFLQADIPVFYLLNLKSIALYYQLPFDPAELPPIGTAPIYYHSVQHLWNYGIIGLFVLLIVGSIFRKRAFP